MSLGLIIQIPIISAQEEGVAAEDPLRAAEQTLTFGDGAVTPGTAAGPSVWTVIRMIFVLILVAAAIYGIVFLFRKASRRQPQNSDPFLKVLANTHLGANRYAHILSVGSKAWLVGSSEGGVNLISEIQDTEIIDAMLLEDSRRAEQPQGRLPDFMSLLHSLGVRTGTKTPDADDIRKRRERLKGL